MQIFSVSFNYNSRKFYCFYTALFSFIWNDHSNSIYLIFINGYQLFFVKIMYFGNLIPFKTEIVHYLHFTEKNQSAIISILYQPPLSPAVRCKLTVSKTSHLSSSFNNQWKIQCWKLDCLSFFKSLLTLSETMPDGSTDRLVSVRQPPGGHQMLSLSYCKKTDWQSSSLPDNFVKNSLFKLFKFYLFSFLELLNFKFTYNANMSVDEFRDTIKWWMVEFHRLFQTLAPTRNTSSEYSEYLLFIII